MSDLHPVAHAGFASDAERYEHGRPGYPPDAVAWLIDRLELDSTSIVLDVAAGTGKLTRLLRAADLDVTAVEPVAEMSAVLRHLTPDVPIVNATAEHLPIRSESVDAITVAQALHWFDTERTWTEFARVIRPNGGVGLIWNARDRSVEWVDEVWAIMDGVEKQAPWRDHDQPVGFALGAAAAAYGTIESDEFVHEVTVSPEAMVDRVASVSHVAVLPDRARREVLDAVRAALPEGDELVVPYRVDVYVVRRT